MVVPKMFVMVPEFGFQMYLFSSQLCLSTGQSPAEDRWCDADQLFKSLGEIKLITKSKAQSNLFVRQRGTLHHLTGTVNDAVIAKTCRRHTHQLREAFAETFVVHVQMLSHLPGMSAVGKIGFEQHAGMTEPVTVGCIMLRICMG
ncbi:MAG: hypothetical protein CMJ19_15350 [Phycisphaeraceae bacterium]|nr:hypothetical protein [Phycisphaeraceae bacterium]